MGNRVRSAFVAVGACLFVAAPWIGACGGGDGPGSGTGASSSTGGSGGAPSSTSGSGGAATGGQGSGGSLDAALQNFDDAGLAVQNGVFQQIQIADCCAQGKSCAGNNPTSPYLAFYVPRAPGQTTANDGEDESGRSNAFHMREDEAIVYVGETPPAAKYFGFTPYLVDHQKGDQRATVFASLSETLNDAVIGVDGASGPGTFSRPVVVVAAADTKTLATVKTSLTGAGYPASSINLVELDPTYVGFGLDDASDTVAVLFRVALFDDSSAGHAYVTSPPGKVLRLTPKKEATASPLSPPASRAKNESVTETSLASSVDSLRAAIVAAHPGYQVDDLTISAGIADPVGCIQDLKTCNGDNRDTIYPASTPGILFTDAGDEIYVAYGVDHTTTDKATYASVSVYAVNHLVGIAAATSKDYAGSAAGLVPSDPNVDKLYAYSLARDCTGDPHCLPIPKDACPSGIADGALGFFAFRAYLEPASSTGPDPATLVVDRILRFRK